MPPSYIRVRAVVWAYGRGQTDTQTRVTTIHILRRLRLTQSVTTSSQTPILADARFVRSRYQHR